MKAILAIDQGTTGTTVAVMNTRGVLLGSVNYEFPQIYPKPGWVEHDPEAIWASVLKGIRAVRSILLLMELVISTFKTYIF